MRVIGAKTVDGSVTATASGTIGNNKPVLLNADGTVSAISGSINPTQVVGSNTNPFGTSTPSGDIKSICFVPDTNQIVVASCNSSTSNQGEVKVGTVDAANNTITWGSNHTLFSSSAYSKTKIHCMYNEIHDHVEILWRESSTTKIAKGTLGGSGTNATCSNFSTPYMIEGNSPDHITSSIDQSTGVGLLMFYDGGNANSRIKAWRWNGSAFVTSGVTEVPYSHQGGNGAEARNPASVYAANTPNSHPMIVFVYNDDDNGQDGTLLACSTTWNGSSPSFTIGTARVFESQGTEWHGMSYSPSRNRIVVVAASSGIHSGNGGLKVYEFTPPASTVPNNGLNGNYFSQIGTQNILYNIYTSTFPNIVYDEESNTNIIIYCDTSDGGKTKMIISTREYIAYGGNQSEYANRHDLSVFSGNQAQNFTMVYDPNAKLSVLVNADTTSSYLKAYTIKPKFAQTNNATIKGCIGFADGGYTNGQTVTVKVANSIIDGQSLTPGKFYYVREDGSLSTVSGNPVIEAGIAISTTELLITSNEERID